MNRGYCSNRFHIVDADADEISEHYRNTLYPVEIKPISAFDRISVEDRHYCLAEGSVWGGHCKNGMTVSLLGERPDLIALYVPTKGTMTIQTGKETLVSQPGSGLIVDTRRLDSLTISQDRRHIGVAFDKRRLLRTMGALTELPVRGPIEFLPHVDLSCARGQQLNELVGFLWQSLQIGEKHRTSPYFLSELMSVLSVLLLETTQHNYSHLLSTTQSPALPRQVKKAIEFMHANVAGKVSIGTIAEASGTSIRSLQYAFQQFKDTTPLSYLKGLRLEGARRDLKDITNSASVSDIARKWGFVHMGRFASAYFQAFGEIPSSSRDKNT